jgi:hypothetical protein
VTFSGQFPLGVTAGCQLFQIALLQDTETGVLDPRPKLLGFHMLGPVTHPYLPNKETWKRAEKGDLLHDPGYTVGRGLESTQPIFRLQTRVIGLNK